MYVLLCTRFEVYTVRCAGEERAYVCYSSKEYIFVSHCVPAELCGCVCVGANRCRCVWMWACGCVGVGVGACVTSSFQSVLACDMPKLCPSSCTNTSALKCERAGECVSMRVSVCE